MKFILALVGICLFATTAFAGSAYFCEVELKNYCTQTGTCPSASINLKGSSYGFDNFNMVSFQDFYAPSGDVEGRAAIRGKLNLPNGAYSFGYELRTGGVSATENSLPFSLVVGGDAVWNGGALLPDGSNFPYAGAREEMFVGGSFSGPGYLNERRKGGPGSVDADFNNAKTYFTSLSNAFAGLTVNAQSGIIPQSGNTFKVTCASMSEATYVIQVSPAVFSTISSWVTAGCNKESALVVNIVGEGSQVKFSGATQTYFRNQKVVYNVVPASPTPAVRVEVGVNGNLLAPTADYNQPGMGVFIGQVVVANAIQVLQINKIVCTPPAPPTNPPPSQRLCPGWETNCDGLKLTLDGEDFSFRDFNVISFGDFVATTSDIQGRLAVRNNAQITGGYSIGEMLNTASNQPDRSLPYAAVVGRNFNWVSGALYPSGDGRPFPGDKEDIFVGGTFTSSQNDLVQRASGGPCTTPGCLDAQFDAAKSCYNGYQTSMAAVADNVQKKISFSGLDITCNDANAVSYAITLTPEEMKQFTYTTVGNCNFQAFWTINIAGTSDVELTGGSFPGIPGGVVYNVLGCGRTITVHDTDVFGAILAPCNNLNQVSGVINGKVVVGSVIASWQINRENTCPDDYEVEIPVVVEESFLQSSSLRLTNNAARVGDRISNAVVVGYLGGNDYKMDRPVSANNGQVFMIRASSKSSRAPNAVDQPSSAAIATFSVVLVALLCLLF